MSEVLKLNRDEFVELRAEVRHILGQTKVRLNGQPYHEVAAFFDKIDRFITNLDEASRYVGDCEFCELPIFEGDKYAYNVEDGIHLCEYCTPDDEVARELSEAALTSGMAEARGEGEAEHDNGTITVKGSTAVTEYVLTSTTPTLTSAPPPEPQSTKTAGEEVQPDNAKLDGIVDGLTPNERSELKGYSYVDEDAADVIGRLRDKGLIEGEGSGILTSLGDAVVTRMDQRFSGADSPATPTQENPDTETGEAL